MAWLKIDTRFAEAPEIAVLSDKQFRQLMTDAFAYARGERLLEPETYGYIKYRFARGRQRWNRLRLWQKFNGVCHLCGEPVPLTAFHVEHVVPLARGGRDEWDNLNIAHPSCNLSKGARLLEELG